MSSESLFHEKQRYPSCGMKCASCWLGWESDECGIMNQHSLTEIAEIIDNKKRKLRLEGIDI